MTYCAAFVASVEAAGRLDATPLRHRQPQVAEFYAGGWHVSINASDAPALLGPADGMRCDVPPKHVGVWWHGWLAGMLNAYGGSLAAGDLANEDAFLTAMAAVGKDGG